MTEIERIELLKVMCLVQEEIEFARNKFGRIQSPHQALGIITEEYHEFLDEIRRVSKANDAIKLMKEELLQIAAVCISTVVDLDEEGKMKRDK